METDRLGAGSNDYRTGMMCVIGCQVFWGLCPIYWHALVPIPSGIIILYRIVTMFIFSYIAARLSYSRDEIWTPLRNRRIRRKYFAAGLILTANWSIYIWAMTTERVIQASIGYYIEPVMICAVGIAVFHEKLTRYNLTAMLFALAAVILILVYYRQLPGAALGLAATWSVYSAVKKTAGEVPALISLVYETVVYAVIALVAIIILEASGAGAMSLGMTGKYALMFLSGLITLIPVALFSTAARKVTLLVMGLMQYISPTISLIIGVFLFREPCDRVQVIAFLIIWTGLAVFTYGQFKEARS